MTAQNAAQACMEFEAKLHADVRPPQEWDGTSEDSLVIMPTAARASEAALLPAGAVTRLELQDELRSLVVNPMRQEFASLWQNIREAIQQLDRNIQLLDIESEVDSNHLATSHGVDQDTCDAPLNGATGSPYGSIEGDDDGGKPFGVTGSFSASATNLSQEIGLKNKRRESNVSMLASVVPSTQSMSIAKKMKRKSAKARTSDISKLSRQSRDAESRGGSRSRSPGNFWSRSKVDLNSASQSESSYPSEVPHDCESIGQSRRLPEQRSSRKSISKMFTGAIGGAVAAADTLLHGSRSEGGNIKVTPEEHVPNQKGSFAAGNLMADFDKGIDGGKCSEPLIAAKCSENALPPPIGATLMSTEPGERPSNGSNTVSHDCEINAITLPVELPATAYDFPDKKHSHHFSGDSMASAGIASTHSGLSSEDSYSPGLGVRHGWALSKDNRRQEGLLKPESDEVVRMSSTGAAVTFSETPSKLPSLMEHSPLQPLPSDNIIVLKERARALVESANFDYASAVLIITNAILLGAQTDVMARNLGGEEPLIFFIFDRCFCCAFTSELMLRLYVHRFSFFTMNGWRWNFFDIFVVGMQVLEEITLFVGIANGVTLGSNEDSGGNLGVLRVIRVLRLVRIIRLARVMHLIGELRTIVVGIFSSMQSLFWTMVLLFLVIYILAVYITQTVTDHLIQNDLLGNPLEASHHESLIRYYGSVPLTILSLFQSISGGMSWGIFSDPLMYAISPGLAILFSVYIGFSIFCLMNITTGVFVESALETARTDKELFLLHHAHELFRDVDIDGNGTITWEEFQSHLDKPDMILYFKAIDLDPDEAEDLFNILDVGRHGYLEVQEFVNGCLRLRGPAKAIDLATFMHEYSKSFKRMHKMIAKLDKTCTQISRQMVKRRQGRSASINASTDDSEPATPKPPPRMGRCNTPHVSE